MDSGGSGVAEVQGLQSIFCRNHATVNNAIKILLIKLQRYHGCHCVLHKGILPIKLFFLPLILQRKGISFQVATAMGAKLRHSCRGVNIKIVPFDHKDCMFQGTTGLKRRVISS